MSFVFASEIGPGFSPDITVQPQNGLQPLEQAFFPVARMPKGEKDMSQELKPALMDVHEAEAQTWTSNKDT